MRSSSVISKERDGATGKSRKEYDEAHTPYRRLLASGILDDDAAQQQALAETCPAYGLATLRRQLAAAVEHLERLQERPNELFALEHDENDRKKAG